MQLDLANRRVGERHFLADILVLLLIYIDDWHSHENTRVTMTMDMMIALQ